ncbi:hypothetical protein QVD17_02814 [Tagetes erecta]|uniref:Preprotein translocase subunit SECE1 n=1 Tax=Tagetes erecta TaxID=13708 RepID=A0AAD8P952_TARER|nr:hypothetical protein QVD17_02814 [Tagetes erecta]
MAFSLSQFPSFTTKPINDQKRSTPIKPTLNLIPNFTTRNRNPRHRYAIIVNATEEQQTPPSDDELSELGEEIKKAMMETEDKKKDESLLGGVAEEIGKIEWPGFSKVLGTTGVVLGVIAGSSVVLLTVNAVFAELSDRVFAGRGVQDFFG